VLRRSEGESRRARWPADGGGWRGGEERRQPRGLEIRATFGAVLLLRVVYSCVAAFPGFWAVRRINNGRAATHALSELDSGWRLTTQVRSLFVTAMWDRKHIGSTCH
jgi:hypothetical protein